MDNKENNKPADKAEDSKLTDDELNSVAGGIEGLPDDPDGYIAHPRYQAQ